jgi:deoxyadenosine/deoxycytidine kinase
MNSVFFAIEGPIGVGKSALLDALEKEYGRQDLRSFREENDPNPFLEKFYNDKVKYAFQTQMVFMLSRYQQCEALQKSLKQPEMFATGRRFYVADFIFEIIYIFAELTIENEEEWKLYQKMRDIFIGLSKKFIKPNFVVYLRAGGDVLWHRIQNSEENKGITKDYISKLAELYDRYFFQYKASPVLIMDVNNVDFVHKSASLLTTSIVSSIKKAIESTPKQNTYIKLDEILVES